MATIANTDLGTSDPVDICKGFGLFGDAVRAGIQVEGDTRTLFHVDPQIIAWRFNTLATYGLFFGMCGPAYGIKFEAQGETEGDKLTLAISDDVVASGFIFGLSLTLGFEVTVSQWTLHWVWDGWNSHIRTSWENIADLKAGITFDLISLLFDLLLLVLQEQGNENSLLKKVNTTLPNVEGSYGFYDQEENQFAANKGVMEATPVIAVPINLVPYIPGLAEIDDLLQVLWGGVAAGPQVGIAIPTTVTMESIKIDAETYSNLTYDGSTVTGTGGSPTPDPKNISVELQQQAGFDLTFGVFAQVWVLKLFQIGTSYNWPILSAFGIKVVDTPRTNTVANAIGNSDIPNVTALGVAEASIIDVLLEPEVATA
jgi:hypothetical protein